MKKNPMILLPIFLVAILGVYFGYKWWRARTLPLSTQQISDVGAVDDRGQSLLKNFKMDDQNAIQLKPVGTNTTSYAVVRLGEDGNSFTIVASLPKLKKGWYQAWLTDGDKTARIGKLVMEKGGYLLEYEHGATLPSSFSVIISNETKNDDTIEEKMLEGVVRPTK